MNKKEALQAIITFEVTDNLVEKALIDFGIDGSDLYQSSNKQDIDLCLAELCFICSSMPDIAEGSLSITYDRQALMKLRSDILAKYGIEDGTINCEPVW